MPDVTDFEANFPIDFIVEYYFFGYLVDYFFINQVVEYGLIRYRVDYSFEFQKLWLEWLKLDLTILRTYDVLITPIDSVGIFGTTT